MKKRFFIKKQVPVNQTKIIINHSLCSGLKSGLIGGTAFLDLWGAPPQVEHRAP
jgi:hypothetical protein